MRWQWNAHQRRQYQQSSRLPRTKSVDFAIGQDLR